MAAPLWFPDWSGETAVLVASGPSAAGVNLAAARGRAKFIAINNSWRLAPWADLLYATDARWWFEYRKEWPTFKGVKATRDQSAIAAFGPMGIKKVQCSMAADHLIIEPRGVIGWGGNSGFQALNLAVQFGAKRIVLVGYDMTVAGGLHWHGAHTGRCIDPQAGGIGRWRRNLDDAAGILAKLGVEVLNASPVSRLEAYPKIQFEAAFPDE